MLTSNDLHLRNTMAIPQHDTNLRGCGALLRELADLVDDGVGGGFEPGGGGAGVGDGAGADALAVAVHATHICGCVVLLSGWLWKVRRRSSGGGGIRGGQDFRRTARVGPKV